MIRSKKLLFLFLLFCPVFVRASIGDTLDRYVTSQVVQYAKEVSQRWNIPGMAISMVKDDSLIYAGGIGVSELGGDVAVDENMLFHIGSLSKSFTAAVMASLVDEGLVSWDDTVKGILPDFKWGDRAIEGKILVRDLFTHKTGLKAQAGTYIPNLGYDREDIYKMIGRIVPRNGFRDRFAYNNITFIVAARIIEKITGKSWEENVTERIFIPLGMENTSFVGAEPPLVQAVGHEYNPSEVIPLKGEERALHWCKVVGPAGSIVSTAADMSLWARFHLNNGKSGDLQVISPSQMDFLHRGSTIVKQDSSMIQLYGYCWYIEQNQRYKLYYHTGTTWGLTAICVWVPEIDFGLVLLFNAEVPGYPRYAIMRRAVELYLGDRGGELRDWNQEYYKKWRNEYAAGENRVLLKNKQRSFLPAPEFSKLVGSYTKEEPFGDAKIYQQDGQLWISIGKYGWCHSLSHTSGNEFSFRSDGHRFPITFFFDSDMTHAVSFEVDFGNDEDFGIWNIE